MTRPPRRLVDELNAELDEFARTGVIPSTPPEAPLPTRAERVGEACGTVVAALIVVGSTLAVFVLGIIELIQRIRGG
jgi:hypothetical protein